MKYDCAVTRTTSTWWYRVPNAGRPRVTVSQRLHNGHWTLWCYGPAWTATRATYADASTLRLRLLALRLQGYAIPSAVWRDLRV